MPLLTRSPLPRRMFAKFAFALEMSVQETCSLVSPKCSGQLDEDCRDFSMLKKWELIVYKELLSSKLLLPQHVIYSFAYKVIHLCSIKDLVLGVLVKSSHLHSTTNSLRGEISPLVLFHGLRQTLHLEVYYSAFAPTIPSTEI